ncbi:hypothetical protein ACJ41O_003709 [Fusarium nematophilum]
MTSFTLSAAPGRDVWRKPPTWDVYDVPTHPAPIKPVVLFRSARVTFKANLVEQYDQGGILLTLRPRDAANKIPQKWIKAGVELYNGTTQLAVVSCDRYADWSLTPLAAVGSISEPVTVSVEREQNDHGLSIWVYYHPPGSKEKVPLREVCWFFAEDGGEWDLEVAAYAARTKEDTTESVSVGFSNFDVTWASDGEK